ncbi:MAG TPA: DUF6256 family protein [Streptosporangiaceae bacterium]
MSSHLIRSDLVPVVSGYLILMIILAVGLLLARRRPPGASQDRIVAPRRVGWPALVGHLAGDALGGYLLLVAIVLGYYYGVAKVPGNFLVSAVSGSALLIGIAMPIALLQEWMRQRWRRRGSGRGD